MEWIIRLNEAMNYLEENLSGEIRIEEAAKIACCSTYHFQRMFTYMAGIPLSEYIRRRRMSLAAVELCSGDAKVLDVALTYGYDSPTAFTRAFKLVHGVTPSQVKEEGIQIKAYPPIVFQMTIKGDCVMNYRIVKKESFRIVGLAQALEKEIEKNFEIVPGMWQQAAMSGAINRMVPLMDGEPKGLLGVSSCGDEKDWKYFIAVASNQPTGEEFAEYEVPAATWAVFEGKGTNQSIQELEKRIVTEWLPTSGYEYGSAPDMEVYLNPDPANAVYEVWIPVIKKEGN